MGILVEVECIVPVEDIQAVGSLVAGNPEEVAFVQCWDRVDYTLLWDRLDIDSSEK